MHEARREIARVVAFRGKRRLDARVREACGEAFGPVCVYECSAGSPDQNAQMHAERIKLVIALGDNVEQAYSAICDWRGRACTVMIGVDAWIGKERRRFDARERGGAVANNRRLKRWDVNGSSHGAAVRPFVLAWDNLYTKVSHGQQKSSNRETN